MIRAYPGNAQKDKKTINNWRTEITALFGLIKKNSGNSEPGTYARMLCDHEDLIEFFRYFLLTFQYPGGHIKHQNIGKQIQAGVKFHPAKFIIDLFFEGQKILGDEKQFSITSWELTSLVFNDLRVTAHGQRSASDIAQIVLENRARKITYDKKGDVIRYAQDILDYLELADILTKRVNTNSYYFKNQGQEAALKISQRAELFTGYDKFYGLKNPDIQEINEVKDDWIAFVNKDRLSEAFTGDILSILETEDEGFNSQVEGLMESILKALVGDARDIGRAGESVVISHEVERLIGLSRNELAKRVTKIPDHLGVGYDILSFEGLAKDELAELNRYIEVKSTRSKRKLVNYSFTLTPNEWSAARSLGDTYFVYRLIISEGALRMFVIKNPYEQERLGTISMIPRNGAEISYTEAAGYWEELLVSKEMGA